jgi:hypothetical protein
VRCRRTLSTVTHFGERWISGKQSDKILRASCWGSDCVGQALPLAPLPQRGALNRALCASGATAAMAAGGGVGGWQQRRT